MTYKHVREKIVRYPALATIKSIKLSSTYTAPQNGKYNAASTSVGTSRVLIDGGLVAEQKENFL
jgi:hypothetical protein